MDPISFTASLLAIIHAARVGAQGLQKLNAYRRAPQELHRLRSELEAFEGLLRNVRTFIEENQSGIYCELLKPPLDYALPKIDNLNKILSSSAFRLSNLSDANRARLTWFRYKHSLAALEHDINVAKTDLGIRLALVSASSVGQIGNSLNFYFERQGRMSNQLSSILDRLAISDCESAQAKELKVESSNMEPLVVEKGCDPHHPEKLRVTSCADTRLTASLDALTSRCPNQTTRSLTDDIVKARRCSKWCTCTCHIKRNIKSPWVLTAMLGELDIRYNSWRAQTGCSCADTITFDVIYQFPRYLFQRYVSFALKLNALVGPELLLRVPRIMPWSHLLWRYSVNGDLIAIQKMYERGLASPCDINQRGQTALSYAVDQRTSELAHFFLEQGVDPGIGSENRTPGDLLWDKAFTGQWGPSGFAIVLHMLREKGDVDDLGFSTLHKIVLGFMQKDLRSVLEACTDSIDAVDLRGRTPLIWAVIRDDRSTVETLLAFDADPNIRDRTGLTAMDCVRSSIVCKALLKANARNNVNTNHFGRHSLHHIVRNDASIEVIDCLFRAGFSIDVRDADDETPLLMAIYKGNIAIAKHLIELGADVNARNISSCDAAIHFVASFDRPEILPLLLAKGADYTKVNVHGRDLGHCAARFAGFEFMNAMLESNLSKLDFDLRDKEGKTARDYIAERVILTNSEIGVREAFEALVASLPSPIALNKDRDSTSDNFDIESQTSREDQTQIPGAFPL